MVQIKIKAVNHSYTLICSYDDFDEFLMMLKERLNACAKGHNGSFEVFFHIQEEVTDEELLQILKTANDANTIVSGLYHEEHKHNLMVLEQDLYSGQTYEFHQEVLLLGSIGIDAFVTTSENMYCIGQVSGNIDLLHDDCSITASSFFQSNIRICDSRYQNLTSFSPAKVYYKDRIVCLMEHKEERMWDVQSQ